MDDSPGWYVVRHVQIQRKAIGGGGAEKEGFGAALRAFR